MNVPDIVTIVTRLTAAGRSALASLVVHGPDATGIVANLFHPASRIADFGTRSVHYYGAFGRDVVDDVVVAVIEPNRSVEIHCHGGPAVVDALFEQITISGAVAATWRQFLERLGWHETRIEAATALADVGSARPAAILLDQFNGALEAAFRTIETNRDRELAAELLQWFDFGRRLLVPGRIVLLGQPNAGKSRLLNALLGFDRVIVSPTAGTTRDVIEVEVALDGWPMIVHDGAGLRQSNDTVEQTGVAKIQEWSRGMDLRIYLRDLSQPPSPDDAHWIQSLSPHLIVGNKSDLESPWSAELRSGLNLSISAATGQGLTELVSAITRAIVPRTPRIGQAIPFLPRHVEWLEQWIR